MEKSYTFTIDCIVPIEPFEISMDSPESEDYSFSFDTPNRFKHIALSQNDESLFIDDQSNWYYYHRFCCHSFKALKNTRQIFIPDYMKNKNEQFPLIDALASQNIKPLSMGYDKAFSHVSLLVNDLDQISTVFQSKCAHVDGEDDPQVATRIHYIQSELYDKKTRFLSGWESNSFATITESKHYYNTIHLKQVSTLYLLFFVYFKFHGRIPSFQMLPRLLGNLWASTTAHSINWNSSLMEMMRID